MKKAEIEFPVYRKLFNSKSYYKILSFKEMIEVQFMGDKRIEYKIEAIQYPEQLLIQDLIKLDKGVYLEISENEFENR